MANLRSVLIALVSIFILVPTTALAADWRLTEVRGAVRVAVPARPVAHGVVGQVLPVGSSITTGGDGRAIITNGDQRIVVSPNSRTTLAPEAGGFTRILQDLGSALFQVDRRRQPHFRVETPLLAAVVKGTTFTVSVEPQGDQVQVAEGLVEVRANSGNSVGDVAAGATAQVSRAQPGALEISTPSAAVTLEVASLTLAPIDYSEVSGGLVENVVVERPGAVAAAMGDRSPGNGGPVRDAVSGNAAQGGSGIVASLAELGNGGAGIGGAGGNTGRGNPVLGNVGNGSGNSGGNTGGSPGNGNSGGNVGDNPGNGNGGGNAGGNPGNGNSGGSTGGNPGNGNGVGNAGGGPGNGNSGGSTRGDPGNGNGGGSTGGNPGNGNSGGNAGGDPGNGNSGGSTGSNPGKTYS